ncbi:PREDICTED: uncharacterized protein C16orf71 homolog isoform X4 [Gavialis gangeticus]|uniref:uncharacterized protein C16orf71 homolog isoform X4 n=1 Tax=Gavialis gangeticus TaxID=94835 RepID=UPI00092F222C|nr:PREDICTED: uncharacterized protein C16orf71 homolog isoform X4 [Gavialis gangeticus]
MASERQSKDKEGQSEDLPTPFQGCRTLQWGAILSAVKDQIPSLDSDTSLSDCEDDGELFIFQRDEPNLIPDLSEELEDFSREHLDMQQILETRRPPGEMWNRSGLDLQEEMDDAQTVARERTPVSRNESDAFTSLTGETVGKSGAFLPELLVDPTDQVHKIKELGSEKKEETEGFCMNNKPSRRKPYFDESNSNEEERRKMIETKILSKITLEPSPRNVGHPELKVNSSLETNSDNLDRFPHAGNEQRASSGEHPRGLTLFSLQGIEKWDLDKILKNMEHQDDGTHLEEPAFPSVDHKTWIARSESRLMAKLEELCAKQSKALAPQYRRSSSAKKEVAYLPPPPSCRSMKIVELQYHAEPQTVYIDLRDAKPQKSESPPNEKLSSSESSTDEEGMMTEKHHNAKERIPDFSLGLRGCTGKSRLLQQLRHYRKEASQPLAKASEQVKRDGVRQKFESLEGKNTLKIKRKQCLKVRWEADKVISRVPVRSEPEKGNLLFPGHVNLGTDHSREIQKETEEASHSENAPEPPLNKATRAEESQRELSQKEKQMKEKHRRQKLQEQLERLQPQHSVTGKQPMAEKTPLLFHVEASFLPDINTLPSHDSMKHEMLLMTIWLSSCGQVAAFGQHDGHFPETVLTAANIYQALVTWLLSLVPSLKVNGGIKAPFQVVGLQQIWQEDGLALYACLIPADRSPAQNCIKIQKHKAKEDLEGTSIFYQQISTFLSHTRLPNVIWWEAELTNCLQNQLYSLCPEIPTVGLSCVSTINPDPKAVEKAFAVPAGFYWQTIETDEKYFPSSSDIGTSRDIDTEVALVLLFENLLQNPLATHHMLQLILSAGLDICGLRLLYPQHNLLLSTTEELPSAYSPEAGKAPPVLALSLRGPKARHTLQDIVGPSDPQLARVTDCSSISALYCRSRAEPLVYLPRTDSRVNRELCLWFGGRIYSDTALHFGVQNPACKYNRSRPQSPSSCRTEEWDDLQGKALSSAPTTLVSTTKGHVILVVSPTIPPHAYADVISTCTQRGFILQGIRQLRLSLKQATVLRMTTSQMAVFCPKKTSSPPDRSSSREEFPSEPRLHCLILLLRKENVGYHVPALIKDGLEPGFELLGLKWLPCLTRSQAKEVTPFEVGDTSWQRSIDKLTSSPALVCALRRLNAFVVLAETLKRLMPPGDKLSTDIHHLQRVMALTPETAFRQAILFFYEKDFIADSRHCPAMKYLPPPDRGFRIEGGETQRSSVESVFTYMQAGAQLLCTVLLIKPGAWARNLARIFRKLDLEKFSFVGMKNVTLKPDIILGLLSPEAKQDPAILEAFCNYLTSDSSLVLCLQRQNAVKKLLDLLGPEDPHLARAQNPFLWRAQYGTSLIQNGFYGSVSYQMAVQDMKLFFPEGLCCAKCQVLEEDEIWNIKCDPILALEINRQRKIVKCEVRRQLNLLGSEQLPGLDLPLLGTLCQTTCLIFPKIILQGSEHPPYIELLDQLIGQGFTVTGLRLTVFNKSQAHLVSEILSMAKCKVSAMCSVLMDGPCLVLAAQRDNAVICFDSLLDSVCWQNQAVVDCMQHLLYPQTEKQAEKLLSCLFDSLTSDSIHRIET